MLPLISQGDALGWYTPRRWRGSRSHARLTQRGFQREAPELRGGRAARGALWQSGKLCIISLIL